MEEVGLIVRLYKLVDFVLIRLLLPGGSIQLCSQLPVYFRYYLEKLCSFLPYLFSIKILSYIHEVKIVFIETIDLTHVIRVPYFARQPIINLTTHARIYITY